MPDIQFSIKHLTRSTYITYSNLFHNQCGCLIPHNEEIYIHLFLKQLARNVLVKKSIFTCFAILHTCILQNVEEFQQRLMTINWIIITYLSAKQCFEKFYL